MQSGPSRTVQLKHNRFRAATSLSQIFFLHFQYIFCTTIVHSELLHANKLSRCLRLTPLSALTDSPKSTCSTAIDVLNRLRHRIEVLHRHPRLLHCRAPHASTPAFTRDAKLRVILADSLARRVFVPVDVALVLAAT
eukprot:2423197-Pleurochrysis_carterae.AAC.2